MMPRDLARRYCVTNGKRFALKDFSPGDTGGIESKEQGQEMLEAGVRRLSELQERLWAHDRWGVLLIFQGMDASGKDGAIKHVMSGVDPLGCEVTPFKAPCPHELDHDFLWRAHLRVPERGRIGIFNRSYYEEVLVVRVHPELLKNQRLPDDRLTSAIWEERFEDINHFERYLGRNGIAVRKFFLNLSREEQKKRFLARLEEKDKHWKFHPGDVRERGFWNRYMSAYEEAIRHTATEHAPWYVVPADKKWFTRLAVASAIIDTLESLDLRFPVPDASRRKELAEMRKLLQSES